MSQLLDAALKDRLRAVVDRQPVTEAELRRLAEDGRACALLLSGRLERSEQRLAALSDDPGSSLVELADALRSVSEVRPELAELEELLAALQGRAREFRASWLSAP